MLIRAAKPSYTAGTLCAKWTADAATTYTVTYDANGGSGTTPSSQTAASGLSVTLASAGGLEKSGYTFGGWNTNASGAGTAYSAGSSLCHRERNAVRQVDCECNRTINACRVDEKRYNRIFDICFMGECNRSHKIQCLYRNVYSKYGFTGKSYPNTISGLLSLRIILPFQPKILRKQAINVRQLPQ
ncbi:MAG: InlB B-repeat-containing protein [Treponema sp.]|nr:InlB B-repeat-containing protein [Treponema sp.]